MSEHELASIDAVLFRPCPKIIPNAVWALFAEMSFEYLWAIIRDGRNRRIYEVLHHLIREREEEFSCRK